MAQSLSRTDAVTAIEDAVHLLRRAPAETLIWHVAGSAPFALGLLFYWNAVMNPRTSGTTSAALSLAMALLLVWMNCCRVIFAQSLCRIGLLTCPPRPAWSIVSTQSLLGATKLLAIPLAVLTLFPLAGAVAFYRYAATLPIAKARRLASIDQGQNWTLLLILQFLWLLAAVNVGLTLAVLPQIARVLTGYESSFTRSGIYYILNPLFFMLVLVVTWIFFDPFLQAVYTVRSFHLESLETGEDLRAGLSRIRAAAPIVAAFTLLLAPPTGASAAIRPEALRESIRQTAQSPEYDWRLPPEPAQAARPWLVEITDRMIARARSSLARAGDGIGRFVRWLFRRLAGGGPQPVGGASPGGLHWSIGLITALMLCASAWFVWRWRRARGARPEPAAESPQPVALDSDELLPARLPEEQWLDLAAQCLREGSYRLALRAFYLANLAWLGQREFLTLHAGKTNREYEGELRRRGRAFPEARALFAANIAVFERAWYGTSAVTGDDAAEFRHRADEIKRRLQAGAEIAA